MSHWWTTASAITLTGACFKVTTLAWEIICPKRTAPPLQVQKEQMGRRRGKNRKSGEFGFVGLKWNKNWLPIYILLQLPKWPKNPISTESKWKLLTTQQYGITLLICCEFHALKMGSLQHSKADLQHKPLTYELPPSCSPLSSWHTFSCFGSVFFTWKHTFFFLFFERERGNLDFYFGQCWHSISTTDCPGWTSDIVWLWSGPHNSDSGPERWRCLTRTR